MTAPVQSVPCPKCGGTTWDNRAKKARGEMKPNAPDYKCQDRNCDGVVWPPRQPGQSSGGGGGYRRNQSPPASYTWDELGATFKKCHQIAAHVVGATSPDLQAATATLYIHATKIGLKGPVKPPTRTEMQHPPAALTDEDDLGF